jgi:hypothetical protein
MQVVVAVVVSMQARALAVLVAAEMVDFIISAH